MSVNIKLAMIWTAVLLTLCLIPGRWIHAFETPNIETPLGFDKLIHASLFGIFSALWVGSEFSSRRLVPVIVLGVLLAVGTEWAQGLPAIRRDPDRWDAVADVTGLFLGIAFCYRASLVRSKRETVSAEV